MRAIPESLPKRKCEYTCSARLWQAGYPLKRVVKSKRDLDGGCEVLLNLNSPEPAPACAFMKTRGRRRPATPAFPVIVF